jgi:hypothetical protein
LKVFKLLRLLEDCHHSASTSLWIVFYNSSHQKHIGTLLIQASTFLLTLHPPRVFPVPDYRKIPIYPSRLVSKGICPCH